MASLDGDQRLAAELFQSAAAGDNANITRLYQKGTPAVRDPAGKSALHTAVEAGKLSTVMLLLFQFNEDPDSLDKRGQTPLHMAASHGYLKIAEQLLAASDNSSSRHPLRFPVNCEDTGGVRPVIVLSSRQQVTSLC